MKSAQRDKPPCENEQVRAGAVVLLLVAGCLEAPPDGGPPPPDAGVSTRIVSGSFRHFCAVVDGSAWCWGHNGWGQLGDGSKTHRSTAAQVLRAPGVPLTGVVQIAPGEGHTCALLEDTTVVCWGSNASGQLGIGEAVGSQLEYADHPVVNLTDVVEISSGGEHTCARRGDQTVVCWGRGEEGQLGDSSRTERDAINLPVEQDGDSPGPVVGLPEP